VGGRSDAFLSWPYFGGGGGGGGGEEQGEREMGRKATTGWCLNCLTSFSFQQGGEKSACRLLISEREVKEKKGQRGDESQRATFSLNANSVEKWGTKRGLGEMGGGAGGGREVHARSVEVGKSGKDTK